MDEIYNVINSNKKLGGIFLDIKKAFEITDHYILLAYIRWIAYTWFQVIFQIENKCIKINITYSILGCNHTVYRND